MWETPEVVHLLVTGLHETRITMGINGELLGQLVAEEKGLHGKEAQHHGSHQNPL